MKIRTQDAKQYVEYGEAYIERYGNRSAVFVRTRYQSKPVLAGFYENEERSKGVLYEIGLSYKSQDRIYYMPAE